MSWTIYFKPSALKELQSLPDSVLPRVDKSLCSLEENPFPRSAKKLKGLDAFRIRIGPYRVVYIVDSDQKAVEVTAIRHRKEVYKKK